MDDERVKSALEIAMERLSSMPELTPEEIVEQKEKQFGPVGQAIGRRYLQGMIDGRGMLEELAPHGAEPGRIIRAACISTLCASIRMEDIRAAEKALTGLPDLAGDPTGFKQEADSFWNRLCDAFKRKEEDVFRKFESAALELFSRIGIFGSAIRPKVRDNTSLQTELESLRRSFDRKLEEFRSVLTEKLQQGGD